MFTNVERVAGRLIGEIRSQAGLTQSELARRAGMSQSVLSTYEHGRRQPSVAAMVRIARAAGLEIGLGPPSDEANLERAGKILVGVIELADSMPSKDRGELAYPPLIRLAS